MLLWSDFQSRTWLWSIAIGGPRHKEHHQVSLLVTDFLDHVLWFVPDIKTVHASGAEVFISSLLLAEQNLFWEGQSVPPNLHYIIILLFWRRSRVGPNHLRIYLNTACQHMELSISYFHYRWWNATVNEGLCFRDCQLHKSAGSAFYTMRSCAAHIRTTKMDHAQHTYSLSLTRTHIHKP